MALPMAVSRTAPVRPHVVPLRWGVYRYLQVGFRGRDKGCAQRVAVAVPPPREPFIASQKLRDTMTDALRRPRREQSKQREAARALHSLQKWQ